MGRAQRVVVAVFGTVVVINLALSAIESTLGGGEPGGPISSSFSTGDRGLEAFADLATSAGHPVTRLRDPLSPEVLAPAQPGGSVTVVIADPWSSDRAAAPFSDEEAEALASFVAEGGRLVVTGPSSGPLLQLVTGSVLAVGEADAADELEAWLTVEDLGGARTLHGDRGLRWAETGPLAPVLGSEGLPVVLVGDVGRGRVVAVADGALLHNRNLARADNAAFGLGILGDQRSRVVFVESVHGFGRSGWDAVPSPWRWTALALALAAVVGLWSAGARFGPPEPDRRSLRPPRKDHVEAVAAGLNRVSPEPSQAAEPLVRRLRAELAREMGHPEDASDTVLLRAAEDHPQQEAVRAVIAAEEDPSAAARIGALAAHRQRARFGRGRSTASNPSSSDQASHPSPTYTSAPDPSATDPSPTDPGAEP